MDGCKENYEFNLKNRKHLIVFIIYIVVTAFVAIVGNILVSGAIFWKKGGRTFKKAGEKNKLPKTRNILILNLSIADILMGIILTIWVVLEDDVSSMLTFSLYLTSSCCHLAIALDRSYRVFYFPKTVGETTERKILYGVSVALWVVPLALFTILLAVDRDTYILVTYTVSPIAGFLIVDIIAVLYTLIFFKVRKHEENMKAAIGRKKFEKSKLVLRAYATLVVADAVCWMPWIVETLRIYVTQYAMVPEEEERCLEITAAYFYTFSLGLLNASANAVIYWKTLPDINKGVSAILGKMFSLCYQVTFDDSYNVEMSAGCSKSTESF